MSTRTAQQQKFIERFGLESVPTELRQTAWYEYFMIQVAISVNAGNVLLPALAVLEGGLSFQTAVLSTCIGAATAFLFVSLLTSPGAKHGIPAQFAIRSILGRKGGQFIASPIRTITSIYWFAVQTIGGTFVIKEMLNRWLHLNVPFTMLAVVLGIIMAILALIGFDAVKKATKFFLPVLVLGELVMLYLYFTSTRGGLTLQDVLVQDKNYDFPTMFFYASLVFVQYVSGVSASSDMARYAKSYRHAFWGLYSGNCFGFILTAILGAYTAVVSQQLNPFVYASQLTSSSILLAIIFLSAIVSMISININNAYTGGYSLLNSAPSIGRVKSSILFGIFAVLLCTVPSVVTEAKNYISLLGAFIIPLSAVIVTDFLYVKKGDLTIEDMTILTSGKYSLNKHAFLSVSGGTILYLLLPDSLSPGFVAFVVTSFVYMSTIFLVNKKSCTKDR
jgi:NCS1 nucleoside transporter family